MNGTIYLKIKTIYTTRFNNCSTIIFDVLQKQFGDSITLSDTHLKEKKTLRGLVRSHLATNSWGSFGIDLAFGAVVDREATTQEHTFLPYQAMNQVKVATLAGKPLLKEAIRVADFPEKVATPNFFTSPLFVFLLLLGLVIWITRKDFKSKKISKKFDFWLFFLSGLAGSFLLFLWVGTDHVYTKSNFNVLWLFPLHSIACFGLLKKEAPKWLSYYCMLTLALLLLAGLLWVLGIQSFSPLNSVLLLVLAIRLGYLVYHHKKQVP